VLDGAFVMEPLREGDSEGRFDDTYTWHMNVSRYVTPDVKSAADGAPASRVYRLDLDVMWGGADNPRHARFSTLRMGGANADGSP
jgi:general secretion pathway protein I